MSIMDITKSRDMSIQFYNLLGMDEIYKFYYDETNNTRVFKFKEKNSQFNSSIDDNFILGGIVLKSEPKIPPDILLNKINLQKNADEFKFKHIIGKYKGNFINNLNSKKLNILLQWLDDNEIFIHFSNFDNLYWGLVDIIDSLESIPTQMYSPLKNVIYKYLKKDIEFVYTLIKNYNYPNISESSLSNFCDTLISWCCDLKCTNEEDSFLIEIFRQCIKSSRNQKKELIFLTNNINATFVKDYSNIYINNIYMFINSTHIFDRELQIEEIIKDITLIYNNNEVKNFEFRDSKHDFYIQVSDCIVGLLGNLFTFLNKHTIDEISTELENLNKDQLKTLKLLTKIINKSEKENKAFLHHISCSDEINKFGFLVSNY